MDEAPNESRWAKRKREWGALGLCMKCGKAPGDPYCSPCREVNKSYDLRRRKMLKDSGRCTACGRPVDVESVQGETRRRGNYLCVSCQGKVTSATKKNRARKIATGGCGQCCGVGAVATVGKVCWRCWLRERAYAATGSSDDWQKLDELWKTQKGLCAYTGERLVAGLNASIDHIIPKARGGALSINNLQWVTITVNLAKRELTNDEFFALCRRVIVIADARDDHGPG